MPAIRFPSLKGKEISFLGHTVFQTGGIGFDSHGDHYGSLV